MANKKPSKRVIVIVISVLLIGITITSIFIFRGSAGISSDTNQMMIMPGVMISEVKKQTLSENIGAYGSINYLKKVNVTSKLDEVVAKMNFEVGDMVNAGDTMVVLKNDYIKLSLEMAQQEMVKKKSSLSYSKAKYDNALMGVEKAIQSLEQLYIQKKQKKLEIENLSRVLSNKNELLKVGGYTKEQFIDLENNFQQSKLQLEAINKQIEAAEIGFRDQDIKNSGLNIPTTPLKKLEVLKIINTKTEKAELSISEADIKKGELEYKSAQMTYNESMIKAPISGMVAMKYIEIGEKTQKDQPLYTIIKLDEVYIEVSIPETELSEIQIGQKVEIKVDAYPDKSFNGIVETIYPMIDLKTRTATVKCLVENQKTGNNRYILLPGMFVRANIITAEQKDAITIPVDAMAEREENQIKVFLIKPTQETNIGIVVEKWIPYKKIMNQYIEIAEGLNEHEWVAITGIDFLKTGMRVEIIKKP